MEMQKMQLTFIMNSCRNPNCNQNNNHRLPRRAQTISFILTPFLVRRSAPINKSKETVVLQNFSQYIVRHVLRVLSAVGYSPTFQSCFFSFSLAENKFSKIYHTQTETVHRPASSIMLIPHCTHVFCHESHMNLAGVG